MGDAAPDRRGHSLGSVTPSTGDAQGTQGCTFCSCHPCRTPQAIQPWKTHLKQTFQDTTAAAGQRSKQLERGFGGTDTTEVLEPPLDLSRQVKTAPSPPKISTEMLNLLRRISCRVLITSQTPHCCRAPASPHVLKSPNITQIRRERFFLIFSFFLFLFFPILCILLPFCG